MFLSTGVERVILGCAAGGGGWPLSGGWRGLEARGGAKRAREKAPEAARPPTPARGHRAGDWCSGCAAKRPAKPPASWWGRQVPDPDCLGAFLGLDLAALVALLDGLSGDAQGSADLVPGGSFAACCGGQKVAHICECVLGVSHRFQGFQGALWSALGPGEAVERATDPGSCMAAFFGAHVNGYCTWAPSEIAKNAAGSVALIPLAGVSTPTSLGIHRRAFKCIDLLSDLLAEIKARMGEKNDPHAVGAAGGHGHHGVAP